MKCERIQPNLLDYSRGLLSGSEAERVRAHLCRCAKCAALAKAEAEFARRLAALPKEAPANDVWALIRARIRPTRIRPLAWLAGITATRARRLAALGTALAALAMVIAFNPMTHKAQRSSPAPTVVTLKWSDDPLGGHTDAMVALIDDM